MDEDVDAVDNRIGSRRARRLDESSRPAVGAVGEIHHRLPTSRLHGSLVAKRRAVDDDVGRLIARRPRVDHAELARERERSKA
jgi:hypothetical protein